MLRLSSRQVFLFLFTRNVVLCHASLAQLSLPKLHRSRIRPGKALRSIHGIDVFLILCFITKGVISVSHHLTMVNPPLFRGGKKTGVGLRSPYRHGWPYSHGWLCRPQVRGRRLKTETNWAGWRKRIQSSVPIGLADRLTSPLHNLWLYWQGFLLQDGGLRLSLIHI